MKCKKCGKTFKDIKAIGAHYRKSHPGAMKAKKPRKTKGWATPAQQHSIGVMTTFLESAKKLEKLGFKVEYTIE